MKSFVVKRYIFQRAILYPIEVIQLKMKSQCGDPLTRNPPVIIPAHTLSQNNNPGIIEKKEYAVTTKTVVTAFYNLFKLNKLFLPTRVLYKIRI